MNAERETHLVSGSCPRLLPGLRSFDADVLPAAWRAGQQLHPACDSREEALAFPRGDIELGVCTGCGFICNPAFDPKRTEYSGRYEETQAFSPTFNKFHLALATELVERFELQGKTVVEIGCGKGEFLPSSASWAAMPRSVTTLASTLRARSSSRARRHA